MQRITKKTVAKTRRVKTTERKSSRIYGYTTIKNEKFILKTAKKAKVTKANLIHLLLEKARMENWQVEGIKAVAAKKKK